ncbi:DUF5685 family protein [Nocardia rhizosphaerae]|uniref:DUF5685 family protein n=1 Tax=Nocardia rhizosphaerae TaxID=1691571 RepID=A0ABV8KZC0_9NOCA
MFGVLRPCAHGAAKYGIDPGQWQAHMCGLCLGLRDGHGQLARAATNTDAIVLSVLTEAQSGATGSRTAAGPCPLRGMRRATVVAGDAPGIQLAATASLLLGAAAVGDHVDDGDAGRFARRPMRGLAGRWSAAAQAQADRIGLDIGPLRTAIASQAEIEARTLGPSARSAPMPATGTTADTVGAGAMAPAGHPRPVSSVVRPPALPATDRTSVTLDNLTAPSQLCAATLFGHTAVLAGRPENVAALREIGSQIGRIAHLADAVEDLDRDRERGRFNPLDATGTTLPRAFDLLRESESKIRYAAKAAELDRLPAVRWALLDPLTALLHRIGHGLGFAVGRACRTSPVAQRTSRPSRRPTRPGPLQAGGLVLGVYCTGVACCAEHTNPCTGERKPSWAQRCGCDCGSCGDCCSCCGEDGCCGCDC